MKLFNLLIVKTGEELCLPLALWIMQRKYS